MSTPQHELDRAYTAGLEAGWDRERTASRVIMCCFGLVAVAMIAIAVALAITHS